MEAAVHATFQHENAEAVLLVDAQRVQLEAALHNIWHLCPFLVPILINKYREATDLFVEGRRQTKVPPRGIL